MGAGASSTQVTEKLATLSEETRAALSTMSPDVQQELSAALLEGADPKKLAQLSPATLQALAALDEAARAELRPLMVKPQAAQQRKDATALGVAKSRLAESMLPEDKRCFAGDPFAKHFLPEGTGAAFEKAGIETILGMYESACPGLHENLALRTRFFDDFVSEAVTTGGCKQFLLLGAGYDARAYRLPALAAPGVTTFEVDQQEVQALKRKTLGGIPEHLLPDGWDARVAFVPVDFAAEQPALAENLAAAGFDPAVPTVALLEGLLQYITRDAVAATLGALGALCAAPGSRLGLSYIDQRTFDSPGEITGAGWG